MISKTVGVGGDYADWGAAIAYLGSGTVTQSHAFTQISDLTNATYTHETYTITAAGSITISFINPNRYLSLPAEQAMNLYVKLFAATNDPGDTCVLTVDGLSLKDTSTLGQPVNNGLLYVWTVWPYQRIIVKNCRINGNGLSHAGLIIRRSDNFNETKYNIFNNLYRDWETDRKSVV